MLEQYVKREFNALSERYNTNAVTKKVILEFINEKYFYDFKKIIDTDRRAEVGFLLRRKNGRAVVVSSKKYPRNVYRIPTGGIEFNETVEEALFREVKEELGVTVAVRSFVGLLEYEIHYADKILKFYSFLFELDELSGTLLKDAVEDEIVECEELLDSEIWGLIDYLKHIEGEWRDWCLYRVELLSFYAEVVIKQNPTPK